MATTAYLRVSTGTQDLANQKLAILQYARRKKFPINEFVEVQISSCKKPHQRGIDGMLDRLIVSELSRLGRSLGRVAWDT
jgi:DNA invertase Pin-like site-specific DNA recombinase